MKEVQQDLIATAWKVAGIVDSLADGQSLPSGSKAGVHELSLKDSAIKQLKIKQLYIKDLPKRALAGPFLPGCRA